MMSLCVSTLLLSAHVCECFQRLEPRNPQQHMSPLLPKEKISNVGGTGREGCTEKAEAKETDGLPPVCSLQKDHWCKCGPNILVDGLVCYGTYCTKANCLNPLRKHKQIDLKFHLPLPENSATVVH